MAARLKGRRVVEPAQLQTRCGIERASLISSGYAREGENNPKNAIDAFNQALISARIH